MRSMIGAIFSASATVADRPTRSTASFIRSSEPLNLTTDSVACVVSVPPKNSAVATRLRNDAWPWPSRSTSSSTWPAILGKTSMIAAAFSCGDANRSRLPARRSNSSTGSVLRRSSRVRPSWPSCCAALLVRSVSAWPIAFVRLPSSARNWSPSMFDSLNAFCSVCRRSTVDPVPRASFASSSTLAAMPVTSWPPRNAAKPPTSAVTAVRIETIDFANSMPCRAPSPNAFLTSRPIRPRGRLAWSVTLARISSVRFSDATAHSCVACFAATCRQCEISLVSTANASTNVADWSSQPPPAGRMPRSICSAA